ncbi:DinB family protein [Fictibacillus barbaricus]|uniref:Damage-inducible protein DinB n=1 Tax=Fictibacillus barbaricus TaxID=182136 RepID=A0ABU1U362_9BACL|nr:DUF664 domain-containing protein [Fictibacillus barbaricus]MDR7073890.1 putative damage-inducible protein DinB [Fictibacillus barbaricus]
MQLSDKNRYIIDEIEGYSKDFSILISMMNYAREMTIRHVQDLSTEALDYRINGIGNSIGMLLAHFNAVEKIYQFLSIEGAHLSEEEIDRYADTLEPAISLGEAATVISGNTADFYIEDLKKTREKTLSLFQELPDSWLYETTPWWEELPSNNYFKWFHVFEDEIAHCGQIRLLKKYYKLSQETKR